MRTIETNVRITIKRAIEQHPLKAKGLLLNGSLLEGEIEQFSALTGIEKIFIEQNLQQIRNWI